MSKNLAPLGPFCYFIPLLHILSRNRSLLQSMKKYEYHTFYGDKYVPIQTTRLHDALIWLAVFTIQHVIHTPLHFVNFCPIVVSRWTSLSTTTSTNILKELLKSHRIKASSLTVLSDLKRSVSKHRWRERSAWYSHRKAWTQPPKELVDVSLQIRGEADPQLRTTTSVGIHNDVHVGNGGTAAGNTTTENA